MAKLVVSKLSAKLNILENDATYYDYEMSAEKFENAANFKFKDTVESVIDELIQQYSKCNFDTRNDDRNYAQFA